MIFQELPTDVSHISKKNPQIKKDRNCPPSYIFKGDGEPETGDQHEHRVGGGGGLDWKKRREGEEMRERGWT